MPRKQTPKTCGMQYKKLVTKKQKKLSSVTSLHYAKALCNKPLWNQ